MKCSEKAGLLIPRPCRSEATVECPQCRKWVCGQHTTSLPHGGLACISCAAAQNVGPGVRRREIHSTWNYGNTWFAPTVGLGAAGLGMAAFAGFQDEDFEAFERRRRPEEEGEDWEGS